MAGQAKNAEKDILSEFSSLRSESPQAGPQFPERRILKRDGRKLLKAEFIEGFVDGDGITPVETGEAEILSKGRIRTAAPLHGCQGGCYNDNLW